jgi:hypothetical protein
MNYPLSAKQGASLGLTANYKSDGSTSLDLSSGWSAEFISKRYPEDTGFISNVSDASDQLRLSDGAGGYNIDLYIDGNVTETWPKTRAGHYELRIWPLSNPNDVTVVLEGTLVIEQGVS